MTHRRKSKQAEKTQDSAAASPPDFTRLAAHAKLNLNLLVAPRQADGLHPLDSYVTTITLCDELELRPQRGDAVSLDCRLAGRLAADGADCGPPQQNLAVRAAEVLRQAYGPLPGVSIVLEKHIPPRMGLGGGSSDAAAVLAGLNELFALHFSPGQLSRLAAELGSDVPLFLAGPGSRMTGRGQRLAPVEITPFHALLLLPAEGTSTAEVYRAFDVARVAAESADTARPPDANAATTAGAVKPAGGEHELSRRQLPADLLKQPPSKWRHLLVNDLAEPAMQVCPPMRPMLAALREAAGDAHVTGSGSAMFALFDNQPSAAAAMAKLPAELAERAMTVSGPALTA